MKQRPLESFGRPLFFFSSIGVQAFFESHVVSVSLPSSIKESRSCAIIVVAIQDTNNTIANTFLIV